MPQRSTQILAGLGGLSASVVVGFLVGNSETHTAGLVITGLLAIVPAVLPALKQDTDGKPVLQASPTTAVQTGLLLLLLTPGFLAGIFLGIALRTGMFLDKPDETKSVPWSDMNPPASLPNAVAWVALQERLLARGYEASVVADLYQRFPDSNGPSAGTSMETLLRLFDGESPAPVQAAVEVEGFSIKSTDPIPWKGQEQKGIRRRE